MEHHHWSWFFEQLLRPNGLSAYLAALSLVASRIVPIVVLTPFLGGTLVPASTRIGLSLCLSFIAMPLVSHETTVPFGELTYLMLLAKELLLGSIIGFVASEVFYAASMAGRALDVFRGTNQAETSIPGLDGRTSILGNLNTQLLIVIFCTINGHSYFIESVLESYRQIPIHAFLEIASLNAAIESILRYTSDLFAVSLVLVFPGLFASFLTDVVFGMFNRIAPQLNAYFMAMGIKSMGVLFFFMAALPMMTNELVDYAENSLLFLRRLLDTMAVDTTV